MYSLLSNLSLQQVFKIMSFLSRDVSMLFNLFSINQNVNEEGQSQLLKPVLKRAILLTQLSFSQYIIY